MQRHDWSSSSPKEPMSHPSLSPCTGYQLQLTSSLRHWCLHVEQPQVQHLLLTYFHSLLWIYIPSRSLRSASERRLVVPSQRLKIPVQNILVHCSRLAERSSHPYLECWIPDNFQAQLKTHIFCDATWLHPKLKGKKSIYLYVFLPFELVRIWTMPETWYYEHFLCLFASLGRHVLCIAQL